jgi:hypothetical protein
MNRNALMTPLRTLMIAMTLAGAFALGACVIDTTEPDEVTEQALESAVTASAEESIQSSQDELQPEGICPAGWTCDSAGFYSTKAQCIAACGSEPCYRDYDCSGACICP